VKWNPHGDVKILDLETTAMLRPFWASRDEKEPLFPSPNAAAGYRHPQGMSRFLRRVRDAAGLPHLTSKVFRRTYVTLSHLDIRADHMAQAQAGHANAKTTDTYRKPTIDHRKEHARRMTGVLYEVGGQASSAKKVPK
jgi:integrase